MRERSAALPLKTREFYATLIAWIEQTAADKRLAEAPAAANADAETVEWHDRVRRELLQNRVFFSDMRKHSHVLELAEWTQLEQK